MLFIKMLSNFSFEIRFCSILVFFYIIYTTIRRKINYWKDRNVPTLNLNFSDRLSLTKHDSFYGDIYERMANFPHFCACTVFLRPAIMIRDPQLLQSILVKNFDSFPGRIPFYSNYRDRRVNIIVNQMGPFWKWERKLYVPSFAPQRIDPMDKIILSNALKKNDLFGVNGDIGRKKSLVLTDVTNFIANFVLSLTYRAVYASDPEKESDLFSKYASVASKTADRIVKAKHFTGIARCFLPRYFINLFCPITFHEEDVKYFEFLARKSMNSTNDPSEKVPYLDFIFGEMQLNTTMDGAFENAVDKKKQIARSFPSSFPVLSYIFLRGFFCNVFYELARAPHIQNLLRKEINDTLSKTNFENTDDLCEKCKDMPYVDNVIQETMRKYPPADTIQRVCQKTCHFPEFNLTIEKGVDVYISVHGIHNDPRFYENPEKFNPDRFSNSKNIIPGSYLPFGLGPRRCIAPRYAKYLIKNILITLVKNYEVTLKVDPSYQLPDYLMPKHYEDISIIFRKL